jgi:hypothetical protein
MKTRGQQRTEAEQRLMNSVQLHAHLSNLIREIIVEKKTDKLIEFQQFIQYAPPEMRQEMLRKIEDMS